MFNHEQLFTAALQIQEPLYVKSIDFKAELGELHIYIDFRKGAKFVCPTCGKADLPVHDTVEKTWRHLNFFQYKAFIHLRCPRMICPIDGTHQLSVPWSAPGSGFTLLFEAFVMQLALVMPVAKIASLLDIHDTRVWRIIHRYVDDARQKADYSSIKNVGIDETSSKRRHSYVTLFVDMDEKRVVHIADGKDAETLRNFKEMLFAQKIRPGQIENICADMSPAFRKGIEQYFPLANVTFDRFHVMKLMNEAVDHVRRIEQKDQAELKHSRFIWLQNRSSLNAKQTAKLEQLNQLNLKTARAYQIKLSLQDVYNESLNKMDAATKLNKWLQWARRSRLEPVKAFAKTVRTNWQGIINYFDTKLTNGLLEGINSIVQSARTRARGFRNVENFKTMIYLLGGKLQLGI